MQANSSTQQKGNEANCDVDCRSKVWKFLLNYQKFSKRNTSLATDRASSFSLTYKSALSFRTWGAKWNFSRPEAFICKIASSSSKLCVQSTFFLCVCHSHNQREIDYCGNISLSVEGCGKTLLVSNDPFQAYINSFHMTLRKIRLFFIRMPQTRRKCFSFGNDSTRFLLRNSFFFIEKFPFIVSFFFCLPLSFYRFRSIKAKSHRLSFAQSLGNSTWLSSTETIFLCASFALCSSSSSQNIVSSFRWSMSTEAVTIFLFSSHQTQTPKAQEMQKLEIQLF